MKIKIFGRKQSIKKEYMVVVFTCIVVVHTSLCIKLVLYDNNIKKDKSGIFAKKKKKH